MTSGISVTIPVGPYEANKRWLREALDSVAAQTLQPTDVVLIDDGADLQFIDWLEPYDGEYSQWSVGFATYLKSPRINISIYKLPWRTGISHAFNYGVMLAQTECVFMLGSDDTLEPTCLESCIAAYELNDRRDAYYSVPIKYMDTGELQTIPCNAAMVTKGFWRLTGGFPIESAIGAGDAALLSILMAHDLPIKQQSERYTQWVGHLLGKDDTHLYNYRRHPDIHTYKLSPYWTLINEMRNILTASWDPNTVAEWSSKY